MLNNPLYWSGRVSSKLVDELNGLLKIYNPHEIQRALANIYQDYQDVYEKKYHDPENEIVMYFEKLARGSANLASGMKKWLDEAI